MDAEIYVIASFYKRTPSVLEGVHNKKHSCGMIMNANKSVLNRSLIRYMPVKLGAKVYSFGHFYSNQIEEQSSYV